MCRMEKGRNDENGEKFMGEAGGGRATIKFFALAAETCKGGKGGSKWGGPNRQRKLKTD